MIAGRSVIAQQSGRFIAVHDENVEVAVVVEVAESAASADVARCDGRTALIAKLYKSPIALVAKDEAGIARRIFVIDAFQFWSHRSSDRENIRVAVVVEIDQACAPTCEAAFGSEPGTSGNVLEFSPAISNSPLPLSW